MDNALAQMMAFGAPASSSGFSPWGSLQTTVIGPRPQAQSGPMMPSGYQSPMGFFAGLGGVPSGAMIGANPMDAMVRAAFARPYVQNQAPQMGNNYLARILK